MTRRHEVIPVSTADYRWRAQRRLPGFLFDYIEGGANAETTLAANVADFRRIQLRQRVLRDVASIDTATRILGEPAAMPLALAPVGMAGMMRRRGEVLAARAAQHAGVPFTLSTVGVCPVEEVQAATGQPFWFQLYMLRDRDFIVQVLSRARRAGCDTLVFTVDLPVAGMRLRDYRNGMLGGGWKGRLAYTQQLLARPAWLIDVGLRGKPHSLGNLAEKLDNSTDLDAYKAFIDTQFDPRCTWSDIRWLRDQWPGKLLIKGVMDADDARAAADAGAHGVIVSNHGGRQLDGVASSIAKLPAIADAVGGRIEVLMDGGVRDGIDVIKALASGARAVLLGRPWVYALAARGERGVTDLLDVFRQEIATAMALLGVNKIEEIDSTLLEKL